eukprot:SAG11_NODE_3852_length_2190_cov_2.636059_2_plen_44_part_01
MYRDILNAHIQGWPRNKARLTFSNSDNFLELKYFYLIFEQAKSL